MMATTPQERLFAIYDAYSKAYDRRPQDWKDAKTNAQAQAVFNNVQRLEGLYLKAAKQALEANGAAVEAAYVAATKAQQDIDEAYQSAQALAEKIRLVGSVIGKLGDLITKAAS